MTKREKQQKIAKELESIDLDKAKANILKEALVIRKLRMGMVTAYYVPESVGISNWYNLSLVTKRHLHRLLKEFITEQTGMRFNK